MWCLNGLEFFGREILNSMSTDTPFAVCKFDDVYSEWNEVYRPDHHEHGYDYEVEYKVPYYDDGAVIKCEINQGNSLYNLTLNICDKDYVGANKNLRVKFETWNNDQCTFVIDGK